MAQEIQFAASLAASKNNISIATPALSKVLDMTGAQMVSDSQNIGASAEALTWGDISGAPGVVILFNADATNYVQIAGDSGITQFVQRIQPLGFLLLTPESATVYAKAHTAACNLVKYAVEA